MDDRGDRLAEFLRERDEPCPACGYSLRGLKAVVCPECGVGLRIGVVAERRHEPRPRVKAASSPALFLGAAMLFAASALGWHGAAGVLVVWASAMAGLWLRWWTRRYMVAPLVARGDWLWRAFVVLVMGGVWLIGSLMALAAVMSGV